MKLVISLAIILAAPAEAQACMCDTPTSACMAFSRYPSVFRGTVVNQTVTGRTVKVDFVVAETFRGEATQIRSLFTQQSDCDFQFQNGFQYVVFASTDQNGNLTTNNCSRTHQLDPPTEDPDVAWLRQYPTAPPTTTISGSTFYLDDQRPKLAIKIRGPENRDVSTDPDGRYSVIGLPPGAYTISAIAAAGLISQGARTVTLDAKGCEDTMWFVGPDNRDTNITGKLSFSDSSPAPGMYLEVLRPDPNYPGGVAPSGSSTTDSQGHYVFERINPGDYYIVVNNLGPAPSRPFPHVFYRGSDKLESATILHVAPRQSLSNIDFLLPTPLKPITVQATILRPDGSPAPHAQIMAYDTDHLASGEPPSATTGSQGEATLNLFAGREYYMMVLARNACAIPFKFTAKDGLVLAPVTVKEGLRDCYPPRH